MDKKPKKQYVKPSKRYEDSSSSELERDAPENTSRRSGMRFSTIQEFLDSLNTATTAVGALKGLDQISLENYQKCMLGQARNAEDKAKGDAEPKRLGGEPDDITLQDAKD
ncbi:hypothetical protein KR093_010370 [Drosophila rubida]|uniref:Uncharacterized protein n=1 Tax=Drosophila rubida TaxID=30044 RepID=A0AAD4PSR8_9MUSC|nr:hypothetical protein KR093_010370 [Drosophila rubida]